MSADRLEAEVTLSRHEQENLQRLWDLANHLPRPPRPGLRAATEILLDAGRMVPKDGISITLPGRSLRLLPRRVFNSNGEATDAVELFVLQDEAKGAGGSRMIRKRVQRQTLDVTTIGWLSEALFYCDVAPWLACEGIRVPAVYGCRTDDDSVTLVMEFLVNRSSDIPAVDRLRLLARAVGRLGAYTHLNALYMRPWAERVSPRMNLQALMALPQLVSDCLPGDEGERCISALEDFIDAPQLHQLLSQRGIACLAHGDLHLWNAFSLADGEIGIIDWSYVGQGFIGEDIARLMLPHFVAHPAWADQPDFAVSVKEMTDAVIVGAKGLLPSLDEEAVRLAIAKALLLAMGNVAGQNPGASMQRLADADEVFRARLRSVFRYAAETANQLMARFGD